MFRLAALLLLTLAAPGGAVAALRETPYGQAAGWTVLARFDSAGFTGCHAISHGPGGDIALSRTPTGWYLHIPAPIPGPASIGGLLRLDDGPAVPQRYDIGLGPLAGTALAEGTVARLATADRMRTRLFGHPPTDWPVTGTGAALALLAACLDGGGLPPG